MLDLTMLTLVFVCFLLAKAYAGLCDRSLAPPADEDAAS